MDNNNGNITENINAEVTALPPYPGMGMNMGTGYAMPVRREKVSFTAIETAYSFAAFLLSFLLIRYAVYSCTGFVTTAVFIALFTVGISFMKRSGVKPDINTKITAGIGYLFSAVYSITADEFIKMLNSIFLCILFIWLLDRLGSDQRRIPRFLPFALAKAALDRPFGSFELFPQAAAQSLKKTKLGKNIGLALIGLIAAIVPTMIVGDLLMSADGRVEQMLDRVMEFVLSKNMVSLFIQLVIAVPVSCYLFGLLYSSLHRKPESEITEESYERQLEKARRVHDIIIYAAVTPICFLYLLFFISQAGYLLAAFTGSLPEGFSYSGFARRGFFELLAIAVINLFIITVINLVARQDGKKGSVGIRVYTAVICFFTLAVIASALSKMIMYINVYGLTRLRIYTGWFMALCGAVFILIMIRQFGAKFNLWRYITAVFIVMFGLLCFSRPDDIIARYNIEMSRAGALSEYDPHDNSYLLTLSDDAYAVYLEYGCGEQDGIPPKENMRFKSRLDGYKNDPLRLFNISSLRVRSYLK